MALPSASQVHVNTPLTNLSIAYMQAADNFVARKVFPNIPVSKQTDLYYVYDRGDFNRDEAQKRAPGTESAGGGYRLSTESYSADVWAFHQDLADQVVANADSVLSPERSAMEFVMNKLLIRQEKQWATNYLTAGVWTTDITGVAASPTAGQVLQWNDAASTPIEDVRSAKTTVLLLTGYEPNTLTLGKQVYDSLVDHPDIVDRVKYSGGVGNGNPARVNEQSLAMLFDVDRVIVSKAIENTAGEALTESNSFIAGKKALLTYVAPSPGLMTPSAGYTFSWTGYLAGNDMGVAMKRFYMDKEEAWRIEGGIAMDFKKTSADMGYLFSAIVA